MRWEEMDHLKARMLREGFPVPDLTAQANEVVWRSLAGRVRRPQLQALVGMDDEQLDNAIRDLRGMRLVTTGNR